MQRSSAHRFQGFPSLRLATIAVLILTVMTGSRLPIEAQFQEPLGTFSSAWNSVDCSEFKLSDLPEGIDCGYVTVPLRHEDPAGPTIQLATVIVRSRDAQPAPDPLFIAQGGPGGSSIDSFAQVIATDTTFHPALNRDLVIWDQRGTLYSKPFLGCPGVNAAELHAAIADTDEDTGDEGELGQFVTRQHPETV